MPMYAVFNYQEFSHFAAGAVGPGPQDSAGFYAVALSEEQLLRLRAIYRSGFAATAALLGTAGVLVTPTAERRPVPVRPEEGGGLGQVIDLHTYSQEAAGELVAEELEKVSGGRVQLTPAQAEARAQAAVVDLLVIHPAPSRPHLLETFQGLWTAAHVDMRAPLAEGLRTALTNLKERGVSKQVEQALVAATVQRAAEAA
jgi:hypothetical protein